MRQEYADLDEMLRWAEALMESRPPDFTIGTNYLKRWWVVPRNEQQNVYLHLFERSDDDRAMHDHPWPNTSYLIYGSYKEYTPEGSFVRNQGDVVSREATAIHRVELLTPCVISLFITGPKERDWGFHCPKGFVPWQDFVKIIPGGNETGKGCE